ncbi:hypothetical protein [Stenotrophomonas rhizophila]
MAFLGHDEGAVIEVLAASEQVQQRGPNCLADQVHQTIDTFHLKISPKRTQYRTEGHASCTPRQSDALEAIHQPFRNPPTNVLFGQLPRIRTRYAYEDLQAPSLLEIARLNTRCCGGNVGDATADVQRDIHNIEASQGNSIQYSFQTLASMNYACKEQDADLGATQAGG